MKKLFLIIAAVFISMTGICQEKEDLRGFIFPEFEQGRVTMLSGDVFMGYMNYDAMYQTMIMRADDGMYWYIPANETSIVVIGDRIFFPRKGKKEFYEEIALSGDKAERMYVQHITAFEIAGAYGTNKTFAVDNLAVFSHVNTGMVRTQGGLTGQSKATFRLDEDKNTQQVDKSLYFVKTDGQYKLITSVRNLVSVFGYKKEIKAFSKANKTDFRNFDDVKKIIEYSYSLQ